MILDFLGANYSVKNHENTILHAVFRVGAGTKLDRDGAKLDSGDGAKLDFFC